MRYKKFQKLKKANERTKEKIETLQKKLKNAGIKMSKLTAEVEEKDTALIILGYEMNDVQNNLKDVIGNELKEGCIE